MATKLHSLARIVMLPLLASACYGGIEPDAELADESETGAGETEGDDDDGDSGTETGESQANAAVAEARELFPDYPTLHEGVIARTCTPNQGVCHNQKEYPDLRTPASMLAAIGAPCNLAEDDPLEVYGGCEPVGDLVVVDLNPPPVPADPNMPPPEEPGEEPPVIEPFVAELAYVEWQLDEQGVEIGARLHLREAIDAAMPSEQAQTIVLERPTDSGSLPVGAVAGVTWTAGSAVLEIVDLALLGPGQLDLLSAGVVAGDPNRDGEFGADHGWAMIDPGSPDSSYLLQRLQGNVPGSPMPLANQPLSSAEIIALACWIESTAAPGAAADPWLEIDYDDCSFAADFGGGSESGGHSLANDVQPIFDQSCAFAGCHAAEQPAAGLDLSRGNAYASLLRAAEQNPMQQLVEPGNPTNSYLMTKLTGNGVTGVQMPKGGTPLDETTLGIVRQWISEGAAND